MSETRKFEEHFFRDLEKGFSADIACCDNCVTDFLGKWPLAGLVENSAFNEAYISLDYFYSIGFTREQFSKSEFMRYAAEIECPFCGNGLTTGFWPYNLPIDVSQEVESEIEAVGEIAERTPFLVLSHPLAQRVLREVEALARAEPAERNTSPCYRARITEVGRSFVEKDFFPPPKEITREGRYNHAGRPALYLADRELTCWREMREPLSGITVAKIFLTAEFKTLNLVKKLAIDNSLFQVLAWSSLLSSPEEGDGWHKPQYAFTRFLADCARHAGFDAIRYPSVKKDMGTNLAILNEEKWQDEISVKDILQFKMAEADRLPSLVR